MPYEAFDQLPISRLEVGGGAIEVAFDQGEIKLGHQPLLDWIRAAARAVATYYGRFPVSRVQVLVGPTTGRGIVSGTTFGYRGAAIKVSLGRETQGDDLGTDWVMTHEMVHLALPDIVGEHEWLGEGIATYVEPLARVQAGQLPVEKIWADLIWGLPKGLPKRGDHGLDHTPTWGRTYWGGLSSACSRTLKSVSEPRIDEAFRTHSVRSPPREATSRRIGRSNEHSKSEIGRPGCPCSMSSTTA